MQDCKQEASKVMVPVEMIANLLSMFSALKTDFLNFERKWDLTR